MNGFEADYRGARVRPSPNFGERKGSGADMIILHYTAMETARAAEDWLCHQVSEVSSHYLVDEDGSVVQMVREADRAWHAGKSSWKGDGDINSLSIGIEIANPGPLAGSPPFEPAQIDAVIALCADITRRLRIRPERVLGHSDVAPGRKIDPGEKFPWNVLHARGIGHLVVPAPVRGGRFLSQGDRGQPVEALQSMLALYGYGIAISGEYDAETETVVAAFQRHFRPLLVDGVADRSTIETLHALIGSVPAA